jgi:cytochrome c-type biogenesis protein
LTVRPLAAVLVAAVTVGSLAGCGGGNWAAKCGTADGVVTCAPAQRTEVEDVAGELLDGGTYRLSQDRGKVVVVNFWGSWCPPCRAEADDLETTYQATEDKGVTFLGVNSRDDRDAAKAFQRASHLTYRSIFDPNGKVAVQFDVTQASTPATLIIDRHTLRDHGESAAAAGGARRRRGGRELMGETFKSIASTGPLLLAIGVAVIAGLVSILSPCVLPLAPGYLSYVTGLAGSDLETSSEPAGDTALQTRPVAVKGRILAGTSLFVLGFTVVFTLLATLVANIGNTLLAHQDTLNVVLGVLVIALGLGYLGWLPGLQREARISKLPAAGLLGAPVFGAIFALSWMPCVGPTLTAVLALATTSGETGRAVVLAVAYSLGLGIPFVLFGLFFRKLLGVFQAIRRNSRWVTRIGGVLLIAVGVALVSGGWNDFLIWLKVTFDFGGGTLL